MTPEQIAQLLLGLEEDELRRVAELTAQAFSDLANATYEEDEENNGRQAQVYSDISVCFEELAGVGLEQDPSLDEEEEGDEYDNLMEEKKPDTVAQAVAARMTKDPWAGR